MKGDVIMTVNSDHEKNKKDDMFKADMNKAYERK